MRSPLLTYKSLQTDSKKLLSAVLFGIYAVLNLVLLLAHEPWCDEAQIWLLARDVPVWKLPVQIWWKSSPV